LSFPTALKHPIDKAIFGQSEGKPMSNRLSEQKSPYLLQHADNPVEWFPWGEDAFHAAREQDKPIFLSIGYATCHWCHVMAHESFEHDGIAELLNRHFVSIKVDREERPDVDQIYMTVCQALTGGGGWPLSVFMTPEGKPFFAGTYFPREARFGSPGFVDVLSQLARLWKDDRARLMKAGEDIANAIQPKRGSKEEADLGVPTLQKAYGQLKSAFDATWGGFGRAPKFPTPHHFTFLLRWYVRRHEGEVLDIVEKSLLNMRGGGIFDHIGFGFHRYSVDERWLVPHFEKMLYDQAMLAMAYTETFQVTGNTSYARVAEEIFEYVLRDMTAPEGGFYSAEDADSEGEEGLFYVWTPKGVKEVLGQDMGDIFCRVFDISPEGNFEHGRSIPHTNRPIEAHAAQFGLSPKELSEMLEQARRKLFAVREERIHPLKDDKILTSWNGLMIAALAKGYGAIGNPKFLEAAESSADFILKEMRNPSGRLFRRYRQGDIAIPGYLDDYAFFIWGLLELYEASFKVRYIEEAIHLGEAMLDLFWDAEGGGLFYTARDSEKLIVRDKEVYDGAIPSGNSVAALNMLRLARMTGNTLWEERADRLLRAFSSLVFDYPSAYTQFLNAVDFAVGPGREIVIAGGADQADTQSMVQAARGSFMPNRILMLRQGGEEGERLALISPFVVDLHPLDGKATAYVCENFACHKPVTDVDELKSSL
jgi:hypothetical protein